jgi:putative hydrolase of the HAD superfamily
MAIRAVFFDMVNTLIHMEPDRHVLSAEICREFGIEVSDRDMLRGIYAAEEEMSGGRPLRWNADEDPQTYIRYNNRVLSEAGVALPDKRTAVAMLQRFAERFKDYRFAVYEDVRPALSELKRRGITTGLISNMPHKMEPMLQKLGLADLLDFAVTPLDANGENKPAAPIFLEALRRAGAEPGEAIHVGDEHFSDGKGATAVGITAVIIDRHDLFPSLQGYHRITSLEELPSLLDTLT